MKKALLILIAGLLPLVSAHGQNRTVIDKNAGSMFQKPSGFSYSEYGIYEGAYPPGALDPNALQVLYAKMNQFSPSDATAVRGFPYSQLKTYEAQQVAAGKAPIFVTATYQGKSRPVVFSWSLGLVNGVATAPSQNWQYAVNVGDSRYVHFWVNNYARAVLGKALYNTPNLWFQLDECAFDYDIFGVLDDNNKFITGVTWDQPFAQSADEYLDSVASFFNQVRQMAPDINVMPNIGTTTDPTQFPSIFANVGGAMHENLYSWHSNSSAYIRNLWYTQDFALFSWMASKNRVVLMRALLPSGDSNALTSSFVVYSLLKGPNFFFAPGGATNALNVDPSEWQGAEALLGQPTGGYQSQLQAGLTGGYRLFWRNFQGGAVYLNWTGTTQTIKLNPQVKYYNPSGQQVTEIVLPDATGTYVTTSASIADQPQITPRMAIEGSGVQSLTLATTTTSGVTRYTLDGSQPTETSPIYSGPIQLSKNAVFQAKTFKSGDTPSWTSTAKYMVSMNMPGLDFAVPSDSGAAGTYYPILSLTSIPSDTVTVTYRVQQPNGTSTTGTVTFLPGQAYRFFPISVSGTAGQIANVSIVSASGASIGINRSFSVKID